MAQPELHPTTVPARPVVAFYSHDPSKYPADTRHLHCLSNFSPHPIIIDGKLYLTSEHRFQSLKPMDLQRREEIRLAPTPAAAAAMGRDRAHPMRKDWEEVKEAVMREALQAKFARNAECREALLRTGDAYLEERTRNDIYWGTGSDEEGGKGKNRLGHLLMEVRSLIRGLEAAGNAPWQA